jgi:hypothetical protein
MGEDYKLAAPGARPVEIEEVIIGRIDTLPLIKTAIELAPQGRIHGLQASVAEEERGLIGGAGN